MRLLFGSHSFPPKNASLEENLGGMQRVATELYQAFDQTEGLDLHGALLHTSWKWTHIRTVPFMAGLLFKIPKLVKKHNIDVVLFSSMVTGALTLRLRKKLPNTILAAIVHGRDVTLPSPFLQRILPKVFKSIDAILPVSKATGQECLDRGLPAEKLFVVPNGIQVERFTKPDFNINRRDFLIKAFPNHPPADENLILCSAGRQVERKGFHWFIDNVMPKLPDHIEYWLAGDGPMGDEIRKVIDKNNLQDRVRLLGRVTDDELESLYRGADLFIMPNIKVPGDMEGFGVVMLEAGLCGLPVIAARLEGIQDVIVAGENGNMFTTRDVDAFRDKILAYDQDRVMLAEAAKRASGFVRQRFAWAGVAKQYLKALKTII